MRPIEPTQQDVCDLVGESLGRRAVSATRFPIGRCHYVYDAVLDENERVVVRVAGPNTEPLLRSGEHWCRVLRPLGVPVPRVLVRGSRDRYGRQFVILERLPGVDLRVVYADLSIGEKQSLLDEVLESHAALGQLDCLGGFGFTRSCELLGPHPDWLSVLTEQLEEASRAVAINALVPASIVRELASQFYAEHEVLGSVAATPFLDDTTTQNVLVEKGRLSGIVDVDEICIGDPLLTTALTRVSLASLGHDTVYADLWAEALGSIPGRCPRYRLYSALFCLILLGEHGAPMNQGTAETQNVGAIHREGSLLYRLLSVGKGQRV